ncbi:MAG: hypothetical protein HOD92_13180 [Deltaproteobacteria bacterium]|jgi:hypothetical protein|nr:hypothetical protein [Deltaproteobacteria bacterium]MBT4524946.1 hypothetical protein [Deltaproteobacteria bacterium]
MKTDLYFPKLFLIQRMTARFIDILVILVVSAFLDGIGHSAKYSFIIIYILYNTIVILVDGQSIGRFFLSIQIVTNYTGIYRRIFLLLREFLFLALLPIIVFSLITFPHCLIHDRICFTFIKKDEK